MPADAVILKRQIFIIKQVKCVAFEISIKNVLEMVKYTIIVILINKFLCLKL